MQVWLAGAAIFLAWHVGVYFHARRALLRGASACDCAPLPGLCAEYGLRRPRLLRSPAARTPMAFGLLRPVVVLPAHEFSEQELDCVLRHELCHLKARHLPMKALLLAVNALHWYNPAAWLLRRCAAAAMEQCCDEMALRGATTETRGVYSRALLACAGQRRFAPALTSNWNGGTKEMKARLRNIFTAKPKRTILVSAIVLMCAALAVTAAGVGPGLARGAKTEPAPREAQTIPAEYNRIVVEIPDADGEPEAVLLLEPGEDATVVAQLDDGRKLNVYADGSYAQLLWPAPGVNAISANYGARGDVFHDGIDISGPKASGKAVVAAADGYVEGAGSDDTNGAYIVINHGGGLWTSYENLQEGSVTLQFGEKVNAGQPIGKIGGTGNATGPHLHFEVLLNNESIDPTPFLRQP
jgi:murein DD-endopeptidase MepM/ murein hydrolase activator NlpD